MINETGTFHHGLDPERADGPDSIFTDGYEVYFLGKYQTVIIHTDGDIKVFGRIMAPRVKADVRGPCK